MVGVGGMSFLRIINLCLTNGSQKFLVPGQPLPGGRGFRVRRNVRRTNAVYIKQSEPQARAEQVAGYLVHLEDSRVELQQRLTELNQKISEQVGTGSGAGRSGPMGPSRSSVMIEQRDQIKSHLAAISLELKTAKAQAIPTNEKNALDDDVKKRGEVARTALEGLRPMINEVTKKYLYLENNPAIKKARNDFQKATKAILKLGPSDAFRSGVKSIDQFQRELFGKKPATVSGKKPRSKSKR